LAAAALMACQSSAGDGRLEGEDGPADFTIVALPDTQYYSALHPEILEAQVRWILANVSRRRIALVVHEGDIVDSDEPLQWARAAHSLHALDDHVPYVLSAGNHDYDRAGRFISRHTLIDDYFPPAGFSDASWFKGTFEPGRIENSFAVIGTSEGPWLVLSLEFGPRDAVLAWADRTAKRFASLPTVVVTHGYLDSNDRRYDHRVGPKQPWNPRLYLGDDAPGGTNDGEEIWQKLVAQNRNILFVLCGHDLGDGIGRLTSIRADGTKVHQILANYQTEALGGLGYLRLMRFAPARRRVTVQTYSPLLDRFKKDPANEFELDYDSRVSPSLAARDHHLDRRQEETSRL
jgi:Calcineurin-like phosphoesterase